MFARHAQTTKYTLSNYSKKSFSGFWAHVKPSPPDPILGLVEEFKACKTPGKVNLSAGTYKTNEGNPYVLNCVRAVSFVFYVIGSKKIS